MSEVPNVPPLSVWIPNLANSKSQSIPGPIHNHDFPPLSQKAPVEIGADGPRLYIKSNTTKPTYLSGRPRQWAFFLHYGKRSFRSGIFFFRNGVSLYVYKMQFVSISFYPLKVRAKPHTKSLSLAHTHARSHLKYRGKL